MNKFSWLIKSNWLRAFKIGDGAETNKKIKLFTYSMVVGLVISTLFMFGFTDSPISVFTKGFSKTFKTPGNLDRFVYKIAILAFSGIAVGVGFKTGLFNIGVSGQMLMGGFTAFIVANKLGGSFPSGAGQALVLFISIAMGSLTGAFAGALKSYFKIHEVVSTILINWIAWYFMRWMLDPNSSSLLNEYGTSTKRITDNFMFVINGRILIPVIILMASISVMMWFIIYKTSFGQQLKMVGQNKDASKYSGINERLLSISSMAISGGVAGVLGVVYFFTINSSISSPTADVIPAEGFDGIAIALIAFSNPIAVLPVAIFFGFIYSSIATTAIIDPSFISLALGVLMYISSIGIIFNKFQIQDWLRRLVMGKEKFHNYEIYRINKHQIDEEYISAVYQLDKKNDNYLKSKEELINEYSAELKTLKEEYKDKGLVSSRGEQ